eukprot:TRINITY_DN2794_c0_g2_i1.p5 TRINITY_DN2794_c0_g2~~TRINITY_DN2794_c0_g2_i1.p5  ORF type:complete len:126 (-),score=10.17 TRINITY_DN2794_c0_g2_i1:1457-1834(-)
MSDLKRLQRNPPPGISSGPVDDNLMVWNASILGPKGSPYANKYYQLILQFSELYPNKPPTARFLSQISHPNVFASGEISIDILKNKWSPVYDVSTILTTIQAFMFDPHPRLNRGNRRDQQFYDYY